jgi:hypothetical protein
VSPDERTSRDVVDAAIRRVRLLTCAEAAAWGAAVAAFSPAAGALTAIALAMWRSPATRRASVVRQLERARPDVRNLLVTAEELSSNRLVTKPAVRERVFADAAATARQIDLRTVFPIAKLGRIVILAWSYRLARTAVADRRGRAVANASAPGFGQSVAIAALHRFGAAAVVHGAREHDLC